MGWETPDELPTLTRRDERQITKDLENMLHSLKGFAAMGEPEDEEDMELLKASLRQAMTLSKRIAKKKFTPKTKFTPKKEHIKASASLSFRREDTPDTAALIGKKILSASPAAQVAIDQIIKNDEKE